METAAMGLVAMVMEVGFGWGGRNMTEVTVGREGVWPGVKGRAVRFSTLECESVTGLGLRSLSF